MPSRVLADCWCGHEADGGSCLVCGEFVCHHCIDEDTGTCARCLDDAEEADA